MFVLSSYFTCCPLHFCQCIPKQTKIKQTSNFNLTGRIKKSIFICIAQMLYTRIFKLHWIIYRGIVFYCMYLQKATFDITADHGAMGCRICVRCPDGFYSIKRSFGSCKKCKDCEAIGKVTKRSCTPTSNSKCGKKKRKPEVITPIDIVQMTA
jgi:hypothetical protein